MLYKFPLKIPTYNHDQQSWSETTFESLEDFRAFVLPLFKEPGQYGFDETSLLFNAEARKFAENGKTSSGMYRYCNAPQNSKEFKTYWNFEKKKCRKGVIFISKKGTIWYIPRDLYDWWNFDQIPMKDRVDSDFPIVWDTHYHMALYNLLAELHYKHSSTLKKRQIGSSLYYLGKIINAFYFEKMATLKIGASLKTYLGMDDGAWKILSLYRDFKNTNTAWYRDCSPDKVGNWIQQKEYETAEGKKMLKGRKSSIAATSFEKSPLNGVGGGCTYFFHEEVGIAPKADKTLSAMDPTLRLGMIRTGMFMAAGSVGNLDQCEPLKKWTLKPGRDFYKVTSNLLDDKGTVGETGLFIPEQWSMPPFIDAFGNSQVEEALVAIMQEREEWADMVKKGEKTEEERRFHVSQHPINIKEAFDYRKDSKFPVALVQKQIKKIEDGEVFNEYLDIERGEDGKPRFKESRRQPLDFDPQHMKSIDDKRGCIIVHERPPANPEWRDFFASIDPVSEGKSTTSESLFCIQVWKAPKETTILELGQDPRIEIDPGKQVAMWVGRFDDINDTNEYASMLVEIYNAWTLCEANVYLWIQHMINKKRQKYLVPKGQIQFLKELESNQKTFQDYGWKNTGNLFKTSLLSWAIESVKEVIHYDTLENGDHVNLVHGISLITCGTYLLKEMAVYHDDLNVDALVTYAALIAFVKLQAANLGFKKTTVRKDNLKESKEKFKLKSRAFRNMGGSHSNNVDPLYSKKRSTFRNLK